MLTGVHRGRIFIATGATDLRKSYDGLAALVEGGFGRELRSGDLFVFVNRRGTQVRLLYWDRDGLCMWMKRLEVGTFRRIEGDKDHLELDAGQLAMLLEGIEAKVVTRRKRSVPNEKGRGATDDSCLHL